MKKIFIILTGVFLFFGKSEGQIKQADSINKVKFKPFSPPVRDVISNILYSQAQIFMAPDIYGETHNLKESRGKKVILWFNDLEQDDTYISALQNISDFYKDELEVFYFSNESKRSLLEKYGDKDYFINIMFNAKMLADAQYASSLGTPRMFLLDDDGYIIKILPQEHIDQVVDIKSELGAIIKEVNKPKN